MTMNLGINLLETNGTASPSIQGAATSVAAFIVRSQRGVPGVVRQLTKFSDFTSFFGNYIPTAYGAYCIRGFFDNEGAVAYATRVVATPASMPAPSTGATPSTVTAAAPASLPLLSAASGGSTVLTVFAGNLGAQDPGVWGNGLTGGLSIGVTENSAPTSPTSQVGTFNLTVFQGGRIVETWSNLKIGGTGAQDPSIIINDSVAGSGYITVIVAPGATQNPVATPVDSSNNPLPTPLQNGVDDNLGDSTSPAGAPALDTAVQTLIQSGLFDPVNIQLLTCPETSAVAVVQQARTYCANRGDCMFVGHTPPAAAANAAKTYGQGLQGADNIASYAALYFPFIQVTDPLGGYKWIPPTGHVLGVYARTALERGIWKAPAGSAAGLENALDVEFSISDATHTDLVKNGSVCAVRNIPGVGIVVDSSRTLSTNVLWLYVNVRLLFNYVKSSLKAGLRWAIQEPNDTTLWNKANYSSITPFLMGLYRRGAFGPGKPASVFTVKIDAENNPPANIQQGIFTVDVYFYPSRPAETIIITVGQQDGGGTAGES